MNRVSEMKKHIALSMITLMLAETFAQQANVAPDAIRWWARLPQNAETDLFIAYDEWKAGPGVSKMRHWMSVWKVTLQDPNRAHAEIDFAYMLLNKSEVITSKSQLQLMREDVLRECRVTISALQSRSPRDPKVLKRLSALEVKVNSNPFGDSGSSFPSPFPAPAPGCRDDWESKYERP